MRLGNLCVTISLAVASYHGEFSPSVSVQGLWSTSSRASRGWKGLVFRPPEDTVILGRSCKPVGSETLALGQQEGALGQVRFRFAAPLSYTEVESMHLPKLLERLISPNPTNT